METVENRINKVVIIEFLTSLFYMGFAFFTMRIKHCTILDISRNSYLLSQIIMKILFLWNLGYSICIILILIMKKSKSRGKKRWYNSEWRYFSRYFSKCNYVIPYIGLLLLSISIGLFNLKIEKPYINNSRVLRMSDLIKNIECNQESEAIYQSKSIVASYIQYKAITGNSKEQVPFVMEYTIFTCKNKWVQKYAKVYSYALDNYQNLDAASWEAKQVCIALSNYLGGQKY